eukprot:2974760-Rhodomonas_salina.2
MLLGPLAFWFGSWVGPVAVRELLLIPSYPPGPLSPSQDREQRLSFSRPQSQWSLSQNARLQSLFVRRKPALISRNDRSTVCLEQEPLNPLGDFDSRSHYLRRIRGFGLSDSVSACSGSQGLGPSTTPDQQSPCHEDPPMSARTVDHKTSLVSTCMMTRSGWKHGEMHPKT